MDPAARARLDAAIDAARCEMRRIGRARRWFTGIAVIGYLAAALAAAPLHVDEPIESRAIVWMPMATGATVALVRAHRAGARTNELEAEVAGLEWLSDALAGPMAGVTRARTSARSPQGSTGAS